MVVIIQIPLCLFFCKINQLFIYKQFNNHDSNLQKLLQQKKFLTFIFDSIQSMFNSRSVNSTSQVDQFSRGKSLGGKAFSKTGLRFFQPKFMDSLNQLSISQKEKQYFKSNHNRNINIQIEGNITIFPKKQSNLMKTSQLKIDRTLKQNINPDITVKSKQTNYQNEKNDKDEKTFLKDNKLKSKEKSQNTQIIFKYPKVRGLHNIGNTCYMNSALQCLLHLSTFNNAFLKQIQFKFPKVEVAKQYFQILQQFVQIDSLSPFNPSKLKSSIGKKKCRFLGNAQQDAQQFLTAWLQILNEQLTRVKQKCQYVQLENDPSKKSIIQLSNQWWNYSKKSDDSIICDYFQGQLISTVTCKKCNNHTVTFDNIWGLPIGLGKNVHSVTELLQKHWNCDSQITDYFCIKCSKHRECKKKVQFFKLPQILIIQLKRFQFGKWKKQKIKSLVKLSTSLNLSLKKFMNSNALKSFDSNHFEYSLTGIINHYGEVDYGHYTANVFNFPNKKWYVMNDSKGNQSLLEDNSSSAYVLFYELRK